MQLGVGLRREAAGLLPASPAEWRCRLPALLGEEAGRSCAHPLLSAPLVNPLSSVPPEIEAIKLAERQRKAERKRRAAAVVGDLQPLRDALPELLELEAGARQPRARG